MSNIIKKFSNEDFSEIRVIMQDTEPWFVAMDVAEILGYRDSNDVTKYLDDDESITYPDNSSGQVRHVKVVNESGLYSAILRSRKVEAKKFRKWITSEVLPTIRKTGGFVNDNEVFINSYLPFADEKTKIMFNAVLNVVKEQNKTVERQQNLIEYKENVINGLTQDISLADKRQIINRMIRQAKGDYGKRWNALYDEFDAKYHMKVRIRLDIYNKAHKPKMKNTMEYIDKQLDMIPELFEVACRLFEGEVQALTEELYSLRNMEIPEDI